ncbi:Hypothetical protein POVR1_LOCUS42 [uncultured virus]|nr:Hypothetical protein POVR1_LOCUS42 [uncultured virus]
MIDHVRILTCEDIIGGQLAKFFRNLFNFSPCGKGLKMAHYGLLGIGIIFIIIGIILFIIGWVLSARTTPVVNPVIVVPGGAATTGTTGWEWFLIIAGVILFIIGLIMVMLSFYWRPAVVVPPMGPPLPVAAPFPPPPHEHVTAIHNYLPPAVQPPPPVAQAYEPPPQVRTINMPPQTILIHQDQPNIIFDAPPPPLPVAAPIMAPRPPVRVSYGQGAPSSTTVRQITPEQYDPDPISRTSIYQPPPHRTAAYVPGYGPTTGVRTPPRQAITTTVDPPNQYVQFV